ncbi:hypothetical protein [Alkalicoccus chagannorensis]|uniref:hypothetical protein n=1 Tax=Alkalicoccus chagannorensis TaxID=427072 RepID=UPI0003F738D4|nr:hypothetical protein [Alkalicoccus chagannorensis]
MDLGRMSHAANQMQTQHQISELHQQQQQVERAGVQPGQVVDQTDQAPDAQNEEQQEQSERSWEDQRMRQQEMQAAQQNAQPYLGGNIDFFA